MIIGLTGLPKSGKKTVAEILARKCHFNILSIRRNEENGTALNLRELAKLVSLSWDVDYIICSFQSVDEVALFCDNSAFSLVNVEAGVRERMARSFDLVNTGMPELHRIHLFLEEDFLQSNGPHSPVNNPTGISALLDRCRVTIHNNGSKAELEEGVIKHKLYYPLSFLHGPKVGFMKIAAIAASWSDCMKKKSGCVIAKDQEILSLGYNGVPQGFDKCYHGGCGHCKAEMEGGLAGDPCICLHAEQRAILSARSDLRGSTLYTTRFPCDSCVTLIIQSGIKEIVHSDESPLDPKLTSILFSTNIRVVNRTQN